MFTKRRVLAPALLAFVAAAHAGPMLPAAADAVLREYVKAFNRHDCAAVLGLSSPEFVASLDKQPHGRTHFCQFIGELKQERVQCEAGRTTAQRGHGRFRLAMVENFCEAKEPRLHPSAAFGGTYVLHSADGGASWRVLDLGCVDAQWVKKVYPPYDGSPEVVGSRPYRKPYDLR